MTDEINAAFLETADIETSSADYAGRFAGKAGQWLLDVQWRCMRPFLDGQSVETVLDIGGGHGQLAVPLAREGYRVTVLGSALSCRKLLEPDVDTGDRLSFTAGNVIELPFEDRSFDAVISFRLLPHCERWPSLIEECCRVARKVIVVDYPTWQSVNCLIPWLFNAKKKVEKNTRGYTLFHHCQILNAFKSHGFSRWHRRNQYFWPMVLHRMLKAPMVSEGLEWLPAKLGCTWFWGSPTVLCLERD